MKFFILMMIVSAALSPLQLLSKMAPLSNLLQKTCTENSPLLSLHVESLNALVCGSAVKNLLIKDLFLNTELYHLLIVSGSHLQTLLWIFQKNRKLNTQIPWMGFAILKWILLIAYSFTTGLGAPVVRALLAEGVRSTSVFYRWHWSPWKIQFSSGCALLAFNPEYFTSLSFYLSWLASLGFLIPFPKHSSGIVKHFFYCFTISMLMLLPFSYQGPLGLLMNFLLGGFLALLLFPLAICIKVFFIFGLDLHFIFDGIFEGLLWILLKSQGWGLSEFRTKEFPSINWKLWSSLLALQMGLFFLRSSLQRIKK